MEGLRHDAFGMRRLEPALVNGEQAAGVKAQRTVHDFNEELEDPR